MPGERIALAGFVLDRRCRPVAGALLDLWHCDAAGAYDNRRLPPARPPVQRCRGALRVRDHRARPSIPAARATITSRCRRRAADILTTQLYFPGEPGNEGDRIFDSALLLDIPLGRGPNLARYDFVLDLG